MSEEMFFTAYSKRGADKHDFIDACREKCYAIYEQIPELPFSNIWTAMQLSSRLPENHCYISVPQILVDVGISFHCRKR